MFNLVQNNKHKNNHKSVCFYNLGLAQLLELSY